VLFNAHYLALFNMPSDVIRPGLTYRDVLAHSASRGNFAPAAAEQLVCERRALVATGTPFQRGDDCDPASAARAQRQHGRLRGWLLIARLFAEISVRQHQERPLLHRRARRQQ